MSKKERIKELRKSHPEYTQEKLGEMAGCSKEYARLVLKEAGLNTSSDGTRTRRGGPHQASQNRFGGIKLSNARSGAISECQAAIPLMINGWDLFRAMAWHAGCDLVAIKDERIKRVEVRSARWGKDNNLQYSYRPEDKGVRFDVLALVTPEGEIFYDPDIIDPEDQPDFNQQTEIGASTRGKWHKL